MIFMISMLFFSIISLAVATGVFAVARAQITWRFKALCGVLWVGWICFLCKSLLAAELFFLNMALAIIGLGLLRARSKVRTFFITATSAIGLFLIGIRFGQVDEWQHYAERYPFESLSLRLGYERVQTAADFARAAAAAADEVARMEDRYRWRYEELDRKRIRDSLRYVHLSRLQQFFESPGLGEARLRSLLNNRRGQRAAPVPIAIARNLRRPPISGETEARESAPTVSGLQLRRSLKPLHEDAVLDFADPNDFGYVQDLHHVADFRPHGFHRRPSGIAMRIARLELMSLLERSTPMVYLSADLPNMTQLATAPVRPLDTFEERSLKKLEGGGDLEIEESTERIRILGSIRAVGQCLECHSVERGDLLGAFSYELSIDVAVADKPPSSDAGLPPK